MPRILIYFLLLFATADLLHAQLFGWQKKVDVTGLGNPLTYNPLNHRTILASASVGADGAISVSYDRGATWQVLSTIAGGSHIKSIVIDPGDTLTLLAGQEGSLMDRVMKSTDGGATWTQTLSGDFAFFGVPLEFNASHPDTVWTMMGSKLYRSIDFGSTWSVINPNTGFNAWCDAALRPDSADVMYIGSSSGGIWKTTDGGVSFRNVYQTIGEIPMIAIDQNNPSLSYATKYGGGGGMLKSTDYGETWNPILQFNGIQCWGVALGVEQSNLIMMGTYDPPYGTFISTDGGVSWIPVTCGLSSWLNYGALVMDSSAMFILEEDGVYSLQTIDLATHSSGYIKGSVLDSSSLLPVEADVTLRFKRCDTLFTSTARTDSAGEFYFGNLYTSDPPVLSAYDIDIAPAFPYGHRAYSQVQLDTNGVTTSTHLVPADLLIAGEDSDNYARFYESALDSLGRSWNWWNITVKGRPPFSGCASLKKNIAVYFSGSSSAQLDSVTLSEMETALATGTSFYFTGQNLIERNEAANLFSHMLNVGFDKNTLNSYVQGRAGDLMDGFSFFTSGGSGAQNQTSRDVLRSLAPATVGIMNYLGAGDTTLAAVRISGSGGAGNAVVSGFGFESINSVEERKELMRRVIGYLDGSIVVSVGNSGGTALPGTYFLAQNFPNPFNPGTDISWMMESEGDVSLKIFDLLGRELAELVHERKEAGRYSVRWNAQNAAAGVYFYRLTVNSPGRGGHFEKYDEVRKMILSK